MLDRMVESVKVVVRCRPMNTRERDLNCKNVLLMDSERCNCSIVNPDDASAPPKTFSFDSVYNVMCATEQVYNDMVYPLVEGMLEGYNATIFAYGQTGCGKSFTMQGAMSPSAARGITPRSFEHIFEAIATTENTKFLVVASYLEIYNEDIRDLLGQDCKKRLDLKEYPQSGVCVPDLSKHTVQSVSDCEKLMELGWKNRATGATLMNADSSRSHSIFTISLEMMGSGGVIKRGKLNLVDLAGSERQAKTGATGDRLKEATKINLSLMALGNVISALVDGKSKHIPYRDSKLTRLLQDSLGGNTKTLMIACLSPADNNYDETLSTLRYANRAKNIRNKPRINEDPKDAMLREYQKEIEKLKQLLQTGDLQQKQPVSYSNSSNNNNSSTHLEELNMAHQETEKLRRDFENEMLRLKEGYEREQKTKQKMQEEMDALRNSYEEQMERIKGSEATEEGQFTVVNVSQQQVLDRLKKLQESMIGGERAGDKELKEKRIKKKKAAEKRLEALAAVLSKVKDEDGVMLRVYDDIQDELKAKTETLRKYKQRLRGMEREISDLQGEFENERTDYLETIRRGEKQIHLYHQITDKMATGLKRDCNYSNLDRIKQECSWNDELECWKIPELIVPRTKLPPAGTINNSNWTALVERVQKQTSTSDVVKDDLNFGNWNNLSERLSSGSSSDSAMSRLQRLERSEVEDLAGNYFKPRRANLLLCKAREDASKAFSTWKGYVNKSRAKATRSGGDITHGSLNSLNLMGSGGRREDTGSSLNNSWSGGWSQGGGARPARLEALPALNGPKRSDINILQLM